MVRHETLRLWNSVLRNSQYRLSSRPVPFKGVTPVVMLTTTGCRFALACAFIEVLSETVQVVWELVVAIVKSTLRASLLKGAMASAWMAGCPDQTLCSK